MKFEELQVMPPVLIRFTHSKKKYGKWLDRFGGGEAPGNAEATTACVRGDDEVVFLVWMTPCLDFDAAEDAALLAHEAVHIADDYFAHQINEDHPSSELKAYVVQYITAHLVKKHFKWKRKRLNPA